MPNVSCKRSHLFLPKEVKTAAVAVVAVVVTQQNYLMIIMNYYCQVKYGMESTQRNAFNVNVDAKNL